MKNNNKNITQIKTHNTRWKATRRKFNWL